MSKIILLFVSLALSACSNRKEDNSIQENRTATDTNARMDTIVENESAPNHPQILSCEDCYKLLEKIIVTSDYDESFVKKYNQPCKVAVTEATKEAITIQVSLASEPDVPMGWLEMDLHTKKLSDITNDPDIPEPINIDSHLADEFTTECLKCCLD